MFDGTDPRPEFAGRLRALKDAVDVSVRRLVIASAETPRRRSGRPPLRLKRSTVDGMISRSRPVRPEREHFEVFVDTCIRLAEVGGHALPGDLGDRKAWDEAYRDLLEQMAALRRNDRAAAEATKRLAILDLAMADGLGDEPVTMPDQDNPYRGLAAFGTDDARLFFGRTKLTADLVVRVMQKRTSPGPLAVTGPSGSGKSSLLRAGLIPALTGDDLAGQTAAPVLFSPGEDPVAELAGRLAALTDGLSIAELQRAVESDDQDLRSVLRSGRADGTDRAIVIVDQFEELFTLCPDEHRRRQFVRLLSRLCAEPVAEAPATVVIGVRADFLGHCMAYPELAAALERSVVVGPLTSAQLREVIEAPADLAGLRLQDGLADLLLEDLGADADRPAAEGVLPLLSHALFATFQHRRGAELTMAGYRAAGGVTDSLRRTADTMLDRLDPEEWQVARWLLVRLVKLGQGTEDTRQRFSLSSLLPSPTSPEHAIGRRVLDRLIQARLVIVDQDAVQLAHEALIRNWPRLRGWIDEDRNALLTRQQVAQDAAQWLGHGRDPAFLYRGTRLGAVREAAGRWEADPVRHAPLDAGMGEFLNAAGRNAKRGVRRRHAITAILAVLMVVSAGAAGIAERQRRTVAAQRDDATARVIAARAETLRLTDPRAAMLLSVAAWRIAPVREARAALYGALTQPEQNFFAVPGAAAPSTPAQALSRDGRTLAQVGSGEVTIWDAAKHVRIRAIRDAVIGSDFSIPALSPDGSTLALAARDGRIRQWEVSTGRPHEKMLGGSASSDVTQLEFSPSGNILIAQEYAEGVGGARLWDLRQGKSILAFELGEIRGIALSADDRRAVVEPVDGSSGGMALWDLSTGLEILTPQPRGEVAEAAALSPEGMTVATAASGKITLWDVSSRKRRTWQLPEDGIDVRWMDFSRNGRTLMTVGITGLRLWRVHDGALLLEYAEGVPLDMWETPRFGPDDRQLHFLGIQGSLLTLDIADRTHSQIFDGGRWLSPDGRLVAATSGRGVQLWDAQRHTKHGDRLPAKLVEAEVAMVFSPDGRVLAAASGGRLDLWETSPPRRAASYAAWKTPWQPADLAMSPDGRTLAVAYTDQREEGLAYSAVEFWDLRAGRPVWTLKPDDLGMIQGDYPGVTFSGRGNLLAISRAGAVDIVDLTARRRLRTIAVGGAGSVEAALHPSDVLLATAGEGGEIGLYDPRTGRPAGLPLRRPDADVSALAFSPKGDLLLSGAADGTVRLWDLPTRQQLASVRLTGRPSMIAFDPGGAAAHVLATGEPGQDSTLFHLPLDTDRMTAAICARAGNDLSEREWKRHIRGVPYRTVCPAQASRN